jgi:quercetin dioxygenase-like cupin family protein
MKPRLAALLITITIANLFASPSAFAHLEHDDALKASGAHHKQLLDNEHVRVLETTIRPGEQTAVHAHPWPAALYVVSFSDYIRYDAEGRVVLDSRTLSQKPKAGDAVWSAPVPRHSIKNVGTTNLVVIAVELKQARK